MNRTDYIESKNLADWYPYWWQDGAGTHWAEWANEAVSAIPKAERRIDPASILSLLSFEFICLDRTLVAGVSRLPWLGGIRRDGTRYFFPAPEHGDRRSPASEIARLLWTKLCDELRAATNGHDHVYMLLSGGMDSRVVAAALRALQADGSLTAKVHAATWGRADTRDVVYGGKLATRLGWDWTHIPLTPEDYWGNFETAVEFLGAEMDPKHLHRMTWFSRVEPNSIVIAASYGDSIGRAEYGSRHLTIVKSLEPRDRFGFFQPKVRTEAHQQVRSDVLALRGRHGLRSETGFVELERQAHYMRRQLCHPLCIINRWARVHQAFTSPEVFGLMWSFSPACRNDDVYRELLNRFAPDLLEVAWARTGGRYKTSEAAGDSIPKSFHRYGHWLRTGYNDAIRSAILNGRLESFGIFDMSQIRFMLREWQRERPDDDTSLCTQLSALAAIALFADKFDVGPPVQGAAVESDLWSAVGLRDKYAARLLQVASRTSRPYRVRK